MIESLPTGILFLPGETEASSFCATALAAIRTATEADIRLDVVSETNLNSQYYAGKAMAKYAEICLVANDILQDPNLTASGIAKLKQAFAVFADNQQQTPLGYEKTWKGLISTAGFTDPGADFGNTYYKTITTTTDISYMRLRYSDILIRLGLLPPTSTISTGVVTNDAAVQARGDLMLAIQRR
jgi:endoglucanase Acf2